MKFGFHNSRVKLHIISTELYAWWWATVRRIGAFLFLYAWTHI